MKKYIAQFLQWCLFRLGYTETYHKRKEIIISIKADTEEFLKELKKVTYEVEKFGKIKREHNL